MIQGAVPAEREVHLLGIDQDIQDIPISSYIIDIHVYYPSVVNSFKPQFIITPSRFMECSGRKHEFSWKFPGVLLHFPQLRMAPGVESPGPGAATETPGT